MLSQGHVAPTSRQKNFWFVYIMDECDVMICLHSAHTPAVARPCILTQVYTMSFVGH